jgi:hypothetical protein
MGLGIPTRPVLSRAEGTCTELDEVGYATINQKEPDPSFWLFFINKASQVRLGDLTIMSG